MIKVQLHEKHWILRCVSWRWRAIVCSRPFLFTAMRSGSLSDCQTACRSDSVQQSSLHLRRSSSSAAAVQMFYSLILCDLIVEGRRIAVTLFKNLFLLMFVCLLHHMFTTENNLHLLSRHTLNLEMCNKFLYDFCGSVTSTFSWSFHMLAAWIIHIKSNSCILFVLCKQFTVNNILVPNQHTYIVAFHHNNTAFNK